MTRAHSTHVETPVCTAEARYWRQGLQWQIVLQIMYYTDATQTRGQGPFFVLDHAWSEHAAAAKAAEVDRRLARSKEGIVRG